MNKWLIRFLAIGGLPDIIIETSDQTHEDVAKRLMHTFGIRYTVKHELEPDLATLMSGLANQSNIFVWKNP